MSHDVHDASKDRYAELDRALAPLLAILGDALTVDVAAKFLPPDLVKLLYQRAVERYLRCPA